MKFTPIEQHGDIWMKRDDHFRVAGVSGGKARTCWHLATQTRAMGLITAGSRASPQVNIVAHIAKKLGIPCRVHIPSGKMSPEVVAARNAGAEIIQHRVGYNTVIKSRAESDAAQHPGWVHIPFGMECAAAVRQTQMQVYNLLVEGGPGIKRLVVPVGSGMSLVGILHGMRRMGYNHPVLGVVVGADPRKRLRTYAPWGWEHWVTLENAGTDYHKPAETCDYDGVHLDPHYEAKCIPFLKPGDCLWVVGIRQTEER